MDFRKVIITASVINPSRSNILELIKEYGLDQIQEIPDELENTVLTDEEVDTMVQYIMEYHKKYFKDIPLKENIDKRFLYNIPKAISEGVHHAQNHPEICDALNPMLLVYIFMAEKPYDALGFYLAKLAKILDGSREAIEKDGLCYIMNQQDESESEDDEGDDDK